MSLLISRIFSTKRLQNEILAWVENKPEDLEYLSINMSERTDGVPSSKLLDEDLQQMLKNTAEDFGLKYGCSPVKAFAPISRKYIQNHSDFLEQVL